MQQGFHRFVEASGDLFGRVVWCELDGLANADGEPAGTEPSFALLFEFAEADQRYREDRRVRLADEEADAGAEGLQARVGAGAFRENQDIVAAIQGLACMLERATEAPTTSRALPIQLIFRLQLRVRLLRIRIEQEAIPSSRCKARKVQQGEKVNRTELAIPGGSPADLGSYRDIGLDQLRNLHLGPRTLRSRR